MPSESDEFACANCEEVHDDRGDAIACCGDIPMVVSRGPAATTVKGPDPVAFTQTVEEQEWEVDADGAVRTDDEPPHEFQSFRGGEDGE